MAIAFFLILLSTLLATEGPSGKLSVLVHHIRNDKGKIRVGLFDNEDNFLKKAVYGEIASARQNEVVVVFEGLAPGEYGVSVIHDENENGELDTNSLGIPKEGFGFGNDATGLFGPPSFEKTTIRWIGEDLEVRVRVKYF